MFRLSVLVIGLVALTATGADSVGRRIEDVTVPLESVTVLEASITQKILTSRELIATVRGNGASDERLEALDRVYDQDDVFFLFFKPGEDKNVAIRVAAVERLAEIDIVKKIAASVKIPEITEAADKRLASVYREKTEQKANAVSMVAGSYAHRMRSRK